MDPKGALLWSQQPTRGPYPNHWCGNTNFYTIYSPTVTALNYCTKTKILNLKGTKQLEAVQIVVSRILLCFVDYQSNWYYRRIKITNIAEERWGYQQNKKELFGKRPHFTIEILWLTEGIIKLRITKMMLEWPKTKFRIIETGLKDPTLPSSQWSRPFISFVYIMYMTSHYIYD